MSDLITLPKFKYPFSIYYLYFFAPYLDFGKISMPVWGFPFIYLWLSEADVFQMFESSLILILAQENNEST